MSQEQSWGRVSANTATPLSATKSRIFNGNFSKRHPDLDWLQEVVPGNETWPCLHDWTDSTIKAKAAEESGPSQSKNRLVKGRGHVGKSAGCPRLSACGCAEGPQVLACVGKYAVLIHTFDVGNLDGAPDCWLWSGSATVTAATGKWNIGGCSVFISPFK